MTNVFNAEKTPAQHTDFSRQLGVLARVASPYAVEAGIGAGVGATLGGIGAVPGAAAGVIAGSLLDLGSSVYNYLAHSQGWPQVETFHERLNKLADYYNIPKAETVSENFAKSIEDATLGVGSMGASADKLLLTLAHNPIGKEILESLADRIGLQIGATTGSSAATEASKHLKKHPLLQQIVGLSTAFIPDAKDRLGEVVNPRLDAELSQVLAKPIAAHWLRGVTTVSNLPENEDVK